MKKFFGYLKTVIIHKWWVFYYSCIFGIPLRGFLHDFSKLSPCELYENVKYYDGTKSPVRIAKEKNGYSKAWLHHRGRNSHHYEYWCDNLDQGGRPICMPYKDTVEMLCDYFAAGKTYNGKDFSYQQEYEWWLKEREKITVMHIVPKTFLGLTFAKIAENNKLLSKKEIKLIYNKIKDGFYNEKN